METVRFESEPTGAEAKTSSGQTCRTPCALAVQQPDKGGLTVTFSLNGYEPQTEQIDLVSQGDNTSKLRPNPVTVELAAAAPPKKKPARKVKKHVTPKPVAKPKAAPAPNSATAAPAAAPAAAAPPPPQQQQAPSPWPPAQTQPAK